MPTLNDQIEREVGELIVESNNEIIDKVLETITPFWTKKT
jgi:hypothetical protein